MYTVVNKTDAAHVLIKEIEKKQIDIFTSINCDKYYEETRDHLHRD